MVINYVIADLLHHYTYNTREVTCRGETEEECDALAESSCRWVEKHQAGVKRSVILERKIGKEEDM